VLVVMNGDSNLFPGEKKGLTSLQKRFLNAGIKGLRDRDIMELLLLSFDITPAECRRLVARVRRRYKTPRELVAADDRDLMKLGVPPHSLLHIKFVREVAGEVLKEGITNRTVYTSPLDVFEYLTYSMRDLKNEVLKVLYLYSRCQIIGADDVVSGEAESIAINFRVIQEMAIERGAQGLVFAHNHTSGDPTPSPSDNQLTRDLVFMGIILQIRVLDHIVVGENSYFSFAEEGLIGKYEDSFLDLRIRSIAGNTRAHFMKAHKSYTMVK
jgi:DNA repair protein RadC